MESQAQDVHTRRALLVAGVGGLAALVGQALGRAPAARAGGTQPGNLQLGSTNNSATNPTDINAHNANNYGFGVDHARDGGYSIWGASSGAGGTGVYGSASNIGGNGVEGRALGNGDGVYGRGDSQESRGVHGDSDAGYGVLGESKTGIGVWAASDNIALAVNGNVVFGSAGVVTIPAGAKSGRWNYSVKKSSHVFALVQKHVAGISVVAAVPGTGRFSIYLNQAAPSDIPIAFFVLSEF